MSYYPPQDIYNEEFIIRCRHQIELKLPGWSICNSMTPDDIFGKQFPLIIRIRFMDNSWQKEIYLDKDMQISEIPFSLKRLKKFGGGVIEQPIHTPDEKQPEKKVEKEACSHATLLRDIKEIRQKYQHLYNNQQLSAIIDEYLKK